MLLLPPGQRLLAAEQRQHQLTGDRIHVVARAGAGLRLPHRIGRQLADALTPAVQTQRVLDRKVGARSLLQRAAGLGRHVHQIEHRVQVVQHGEVIGELGVHAGLHQAGAGGLP